MLSTLRPFGYWFLTLVLRPSIVSRLHAVESCPRLHWNAAVRLRTIADAVGRIHILLGTWQVGIAGFRPGRADTSNAGAVRPRIAEV